MTYAEPVISDPRKEHGIFDWPCFQPAGPTARREDQVLSGRIRSSTIPKYEDFENYYFWTLYGTCDSIKEQGV